MNHQPTQLALLISLIGVGVAPCANASSNPSARLDGRVVDTIDVMQELPGVTCNELEAAALPACGANTDLAWQPPRNPLDRTATAGVRVLYTTARDDTAPGEVAEEFARLGHWTPREIVEHAAAKPVEARELPRQPNRKSAGRIAGKSTGKSTGKATGQHADKSSARQMRVLAQAPARMQAQRIDSAIERLAHIEPVASSKTAPPVAEPGSKHVASQLENLVAVLDAALAVEASPPAPIAELVEAPAPIRLREAEPAHVARAQAAIDTESNKVLSSLGAILFEARDQVGAIRPPESQAVVTTQTGKVIAMLGEVAAAQPVIEDGPARRLRKLAARAAKAEAKAAAEAAPAVADALAYALVAEVAREGVDLMLPLEMPTFAASLPDDAQASRALIEPAALPVGAQVAAAAPPPAPRANPFGDKQVAIAESSLDRVRGGFSVSGLNISFGIERATYINGALVTTTSLNVSDLGRITAGAAASFNVGSMGVIQSGSGNVVSPTMISAGSVGTVIQNTLDGQKIQNVTIINATTNSLGLLKGINMQSSLRGAVIDSLRR